MATVEKLENQILNTIRKLGKNKKQPNEHTVYHVILQSLQSLSKEKLQETLNKPINDKKLKIKLHNGKNSYYIENKSCHEDKSNGHVIENVKDLSTSDTETPLPQHNIETPKIRNFVMNEIENETDQKL